MDRVQGVTATSDHRFTEGDPALGVSATIVPATWLNGLQEELIHLLELAGITPDDGNFTQVKAALDVLYAGAGDITALTTALSTETAARQTADAALVSGLGSVNSRVTVEETARAGADASLLSSMQAADNTLQGQITAEVVSRQNAVTTEEDARTAADAALSTALGLQQVYTREFSNGLMDFFPLATPDDPTEIRSQCRIVHHRNPAGKTSYAEMFFHWSATFLGSLSAGWTIPDSSDALGADIDSALREVWGIGPSDEWKFPNLHGTLQCAAKSYTVVIYHQSTGAVYSIIGWDQAANRLPFGDLRFLVPGETL